MESANPQILDETESYSPPYWWTKRIVVVVGILIFLLLIARLLWGWDANRRLQAEIDAIRARGEPIRPEDFQKPHVPDEENYVHYLRQAQAKINRAAEPPTYSPNPTWGFEEVTSSAWRNAAANAVAGNSTALALLRAARERGKVDWGDARAASISGAAAPSFWNYRFLAILTSDAARHDHWQGDDREAIERVEDSLAMATAERQHPSLFGWLLGMGDESFAVSALLKMAPTLEIEIGAAISPQGHRPATREQVKRLIGQLISPAPSLEHALLAERMLVADRSERDSQDFPLIRPAYSMDAARVLRWLGSEIAASAQNSNPAAQRMIRPRPHFAQDDFVHAVARDRSWAPNRVLESSFGQLFDRQAAAVSLAMRLYRLDHAGRWPPDLKSLVPDYLAGIPADPFSPVRAPIVYVMVQSGTRPLVYSVGPDGADDTAKGAAPGPEPHYGWTGQDPDAWCDLSEINYLPPPVTQPAQ